MLKDRKAMCPSGDPDHKTFMVTAHVAESWYVDDRGNFLEVYETLETVKAPSEDHDWDCAECGETAVFKDRGATLEKGELKRLLKNVSNVVRFPDQYSWQERLDLIGQLDEAEDRL